MTSDMIKSLIERKNQAFDLFKANQFEKSITALSGVVSELDKVMKSNDAKVLEELKRMEPDECYNRMGAAYFKLGRYKEAIENCDKAILRAVRPPSLLSLRVNAAKINLYLGNYQKARAELGEVLKHNPDHANALRVKASVDETLKDVKTARESFFDGRYGECIKLCDIALRRGEREDQNKRVLLFYQLEGLSYIETKQYSKAIEIFDKGIAVFEGTDKDLSKLVGYKAYCLACKEGTSSETKAFFMQAALKDFSLVYPVDDKILKQLDEWVNRLMKAPMIPKVVPTTLEELKAKQTAEQKYAKMYAKDYADLRAGVFNRSSAERFAWENLRLCIKKNDLKSDLKSDLESIKEYVKSVLQAHAKANDQNNAQANVEANDQVSSSQSSDQVSISQSSGQVSSDHDNIDAYIHDGILGSAVAQAGC